MSIAGAGPEPIGGGSDLDGVTAGGCSVAELAAGAKSPSYKPAIGLKCEIVGTIAADGSGGFGRQCPSETANGFANVTATIAPRIEASVRF